MCSIKLYVHKHVEIYMYIEITRNKYINYLKALSTGPTEILELKY